MNLTEDELLPLLGGVSAGSEPYTRRVFGAAPGLRVVARAGVGFDAVDVAAATDHGVAVAITPGANAAAVAEHAFALMLALAKDVLGRNAAVKAGDWPRQASRPLRGRTQGLVGLGRIGQAVAALGTSFGMRLVACEPTGPGVRRPPPGPAPAAGPGGGGG